QRLPYEYAGKYGERSEYRAVNTERDPAEFRSKGYGISWRCREIGALCAPVVGAPGWVNPGYAPVTTAAELSRAAVEYPHGQCPAGRRLGAVPAGAPIGPGRRILRPAEARAAPTNDQLLRAHSLAGASAGRPAFRVRATHAPRSGRGGRRRAGGQSGKLVPLLLRRGPGAVVVSGHVPEGAAVNSTVTSGRPAAIACGPASPRQLQRAERVSRQLVSRRRRSTSTASRTPRPVIARVIDSDWRDLHRDVSARPGR